MGPGELDTPDGNGDETRAASSDTPRRAEHRQAGDGGQSRAQASRAPAETLTREDYGDRLREHGPAHTRRHPPSRRPTRHQPRDAGARR